MGCFIIKRSVLIRIGKYLSMREEDKKVKELLARFHKLNQLNYAQYHDKRYEGPLYRFDNVIFKNEPLYAAIQIQNDISRLYYHSMDFGDDIDEGAIIILQQLFDEIVVSPQYQTTQSLKQFISS